jgi:prepilin-type N-terminal cleavage/methylation domain-containing protein
MASLTGFPKPLGSEFQKYDLKIFMESHAKINLFDKKSGFTLIELSIVLVIIGLIIGGVLVGRDLISAAEIHAQISQIEKYQTAVNTFRIKYGSLPGDIKNSDATAYGFAARGTLRGQGDGNGVIEGRTGTNGKGDYIACGETGLFWRDLSSANIIDGSFTTASYSFGIAPCTSAISGTTLNKYFPAARIGKNNYVYVWSGGWGVYLGPSDRTNYFGISRITNAYITATDVSITPNQAYAIDAKIDDGLPQSGKVLAMYPNHYAEARDWTYSFWSAGGTADPTYGQYKAGACDNYTDCGPVTVNTSPAITSDAQTDYNNGWLDCFDNRNVANATMQYSTQFMGGNNPACALSFKFQ